MKKAIISLGATVWLVLSCTKHAVPEYYYAVDLNQITNDELRVEMNFTGVLPDTGNFYFPRIVPGIYDAGEYDKFVSNLRAFNRKGQDLVVNRIDTNCWQIIGANKLHAIFYSVSDGWASSILKVSDHTDLQKAILIVPL
jgi:predicted metalloprotease with PDZ domain